MFSDVLTEISYVRSVRRLIILLTILTLQVYAKKEGVDTIFVCNNHPRNPVKGHILRIDTATQVAAEVRHTNGGNPVSVVFNTQNQQLYWTEMTNRIRTVDLKASRPTYVVTKLPYNDYKFRLIIIDIGRQYIMFSNTKQTKQIFKLHLNEPEVESSPICFASQDVAAMAVSPEFGFLFYATVNLKTITQCTYGKRSGAYSGKVTYSATVNFLQTFGLGIESFSTKLALYWVDPTTNTIYKGFILSHLNTVTPIAIHNETMGATFQGIKFYRNNLYVTTYSPKAIRIFSKTGIEQRKIPFSDADLRFTGIDVANVMSDVTTGAPTTVDPGDSTTEDTGVSETPDSGDSETGDSTTDDGNPAVDTGNSTTTVSEAKKGNTEMYLLIIGGILLLLVLIVFRPKIKKKCKKILKK